MTGAVIGALRVTLGADSAAFEADLKKAQSALSAFGSSVNNIGSAFTKALVFAGVAASIGELGHAISGAIDGADQLGKSAQKIGIPVEQLSALKFAADLSGVSMESLQKGTEKLGKAMTEAAAKPLSGAADAFRAIGVSATDSSGHIRPVNDVILDLAGKFEGIKDGAGKTAIAIALFGKAGADLIPLINQGKAGIQRLTEEAGKLGIVLSGETVAGATEVHDNMKRLGTVWDAIILQITGGMLPGMKQLSAQLVETAKRVDWTAFGKSVTDAFSGVLESLDLWNLRLERIGVTWAAVKTLFTTTGSLSEAWKALSDVIAENQSKMQSLRLAQAETRAGWNGVSTAAAEAAKTQKDFNYSALAGKTAFDSFLDSTRKATAGLQAQAQTVGLTSGETARLKTTLEGLQVAQAAHINLSAKQRAELAAAGEAAAQAAMKFRGAQITQETLTPMQLYAQQLGELNTLLINGKISQDAFNQKVLMLQAPQLSGMVNDFRNLGKQLDSIATGSINALTGAITDVVMGTKKAGDALKEFGLAVAKMVVELVVKMLIALPIALALRAALSGIGFGFAGGGSLLGFKEGGSLLGFAGGGSFTVPGAAAGMDFTVPGGRSMSDNMLMPIALASGERVRVEPNKYGEDGFSRSSNSQPSVVNMNMPFVTTRDAMRQVIDELNGMFRDGYRLNVA